MEIKPMNPKFTQKELTKELGWSISNLKRYRHDIEMLSPYRIQSNLHKIK